MNSFAHTLGQGTARVIDGTQDAVEATWDNSKIAATAFGKGYREQRALNLMKREQRRATRELRSSPRYAVIVRHEWRAS